MGGNSSKLDDDLKENKKQINRTIRDLERQKLSTERQEESLVSKLRVEARAGRTTNARLMAKDVLRNRRLANHYCNMKSQMMALQSQLQTAQSANLISKRFKNVSDLMTQVNLNTNVAEFQKIMNNISQQGVKLNLKLDMMSEAMDDSLLDVEGTMDEEKAVDELMEELGVGISTTLDNLKPPSSQDLNPSSNKTGGITNLNDSGMVQEMVEIEERINNLKM